MASIHSRTSASTLAQAAHASRSVGTHLDMKKVNITITILIFIILGSCDSRNENIMNERYELMYQRLKFVTIDSLININTKIDQTLNNYYPNHISIRLNTSELLQYLNDLNERIITYSGGYDEYRTFTNSGNYKMINRFFFEDEVDRQKETVRFEKRLMSYKKYLSSLNISSNFYYQPNEHPYWSKIPQRRNASFTEVLLDNTTVIQGILAISELQVNILVEENSYYVNQLLKTCANNGEHAGPL
jgi:hypothetical protein